MSGGDFLARWSRRKRAVEAAESAPAIAPELPGADAGGGGGGNAPPAAAPEAGALTPEEIAALPRIEDLTGEMDLTAFLRAGVPSVLRNAALRRMWSLDPTIRDFLSEARDYAYDWNVVGGVPGNGPLEPGTDVKAMVRAIFGDREAPAAETQAAAEDLPGDSAAGEPFAGDPEAEGSVSKKRDSGGAPARIAEDDPRDPEVAAHAGTPHDGGAANSSLRLSERSGPEAQASQRTPDDFAERSQSTATHNESETVTKRAVRRHGSAIPI